MALENNIMMADPSMAALGAVIGGFIVGLVFVFLAVYIYNAIALMTVANKLKTNNSYLAFIPIANVYLTTQMAKVPGWWTFGLLLTLIPHLGTFLILAGMLFLWWRIAERLGKPNWWAILMVVPLVNLITIGILAWGKTGHKEIEPITSGTVSKKRGFKK